MWVEISLACVQGQRESERDRDWTGGREGRRPPGQDTGIPDYLQKVKSLFHCSVVVLREQGLAFWGTLSRSYLDPTVMQRIVFVHICACMCITPPPGGGKPFLLESSRMYHFQQGCEEWSEGYFIYVYEAQQAIFSLFLSVHRLIFLTHDICHCKNKQENISKKVNMMAESSSRITAWTILESILLNITLSAHLLLTWPGLSSVVTSCQAALEQFSWNVASLNGHELYLSNPQRILKKKRKKWGYKIDIKFRYWLQVEMIIL